MFFFCLLCPGAGLCQQDAVADSLSRELKRAEDRKDNDAQLKVLSALIEYYYTFDPLVSMGYADQMVALAKDSDQLEALITAYSDKGDINVVLGNDEQAIADYEHARELARDGKLKLREGTAMHNLAIVYTNRSEYLKALELRKESLVIFEEQNSLRHQQAAHTNLGVTYFYLGDYQQAIDHYYDAIKLADVLGKPELKYNPYQNIGLIYKKLEEYDKALQMYGMARQLLESGVGTQSDLVNLLENIASAYDAKGLPDTAIVLYRRSLLLSRKMGYARGEASALTSLGVVYSGLGEHVTAMDDLRQALVLYRHSPDYDATSVLYATKAQILLAATEADLERMGVSSAGRMADAKRAADTALAHADRAESPSRRADALEVLAGIYKKQGAYAQALAAYEGYIAIRDSLFGEEKKADMVRTEMQYELGRRDAEAAAELQRHRTVRNAIMAGGVWLLLAGGGVFMAYKKRKDALEKQRELAHQSALLEHTMRVLRLQMNPHFIFNSLNSISDYISKNDIDSADYYLAKFAKLMRGILENSEEREIPLADELRMLELYMQLEASRLAGKFSYEIRVSEDIDPDNVSIPPLILQPFVENSIWHGIAHKEGKGRILIGVTQDNGMLSCSVEDDGVGRHNRGKHAGRKSYGVSISRDRIDMLNKWKHTHASVNIIDLEQGTRVEMKLPLDAAV